jgi:hypothetical protein
MEPGLVAGIAGVLVLVVVVGLIAYRRARKHRSIGVPVEASRPSFTTRAEVVETIAALDVSFQAGSISESEWRTRRNQLKDELREFAPEPAQ